MVRGATFCAVQVPLPVDQEPFVICRRPLVALGALLMSAACSSADMPANPIMAPDATTTRMTLSAAGAPPLVGLGLVNIPTYEGSGQVVHPDVLYFPGGWRGWEYWMAFTPYPGGNPDHENPSLVVSHDGRNWSVPEGLTNPIRGTPDFGYNSDPDLSYDATRDRLVMLYREVRGDFNQIYSLSSNDGTTWSAPTMVFRRPNHGMISPTMVLGRGAQPKVWYVDAGVSYSCAKRVTNVRLSTAGNSSALAPAAPGAGWGRQVTAKLAQPGYSIWHLDVIYVPTLKEYWAVYPAYRSKTCQAEELFFARSRDGVRWESYAVPFLRRNAASWTSERVYRASIVYDGARDAIRFYVSGAGSSDYGLWRIGYVEYARRDFLLALKRGVPESPTLPPAPVNSRREIQEP